MQKRAFTLIELLVAIAIIGILATILFPVFGRARENARRSSCASNLKQIGTGLIQYAQDYDEKMPLWSKNSAGVNLQEANDFLNPTASPNPLRAVSPYVKSSQVYACPSAKPRTDWAAPTALSNLSYMPNATPLEIHIATFPSPAELVFIHENPNRQHKIELRPTVVAGTGGRRFQYFSVLTAEGVPVYNNLHFDGGNLMYVDGHVKWLKNSAMRASMWGIGGSTGNCTATGTADDTTVSGAGKTHCRTFG